MLTFGGKSIGNGSPCFVIAEIGQNHQGSLEIAKEMIGVAKKIGVDCVKFQKSCLSEKFTRAALERPYIGANSWGNTYGEHKLFLEFTIEEYGELQKFCDEIGILFTASAMDLVSFTQLQQMRVPFIKIGSGDADNLQMLRYAALQNDEIPLVISTGMQPIENVRKINEILSGRQHALMHCVSSYPTRPRDTHLRMIEVYKKMFPNIVIGYSGHETGIQLSLASVLMGAKIVERHFTLDKTMKGSDHNASLTPIEFEKLIKLIRHHEAHVNAGEVLTVLSDLMHGDEDFNEDEVREALKPVAESDRALLKCEKACHDKLGKSLVYSKSLEKDHQMSEGDISVKVSEPKGLPPMLYDHILGRKLRNSTMADNPILECDFL